MKFAKKILVSALLASSVISGIAQAATTPAGVASSTFTLVDRGVQITLASTLGYFVDFDAAIKKIDPNGKLTLKASGILDVTIFGTIYHVQPMSTSLVSPVPGPLLVVYNNNVYFIDSNSQVQQLIILP